MRKSPPWSHLSSTISRDGTVSLKVRTSISTLTAIPWPKATSTRKTQQLLADYQLIQYDITTGKNYLKDTDFMDLP